MQGLGVGVILHERAPGERCFSAKEPQLGKRFSLNVGGVPGFSVGIDTVVEEVGRAIEGAFVYGCHNSSALKSLCLYLKQIFNLGFCIIAPTQFQSLQ